MAGKDLVQSLLRGLEILELVGASEGGLSQADLAALLDVKQPTVANLTRTLLHKGYLRKQSKPVRYRLGNALQELIEREQNRSLLSMAAKEMLAIGRELDEIALVYTEAFGADLIPRLRLSSETPLYVERRPRSGMGPYSSATGLGMQAFMMPEDRRLFRQRHPFAEHANSHWQNEDELDAFLAEVRQRGHLEMAQGQCFRISAPVYDGSQRLYAILGISCNSCNPCPPKRQRELTASVLAATERLSASWEGQGLTT